MVEGSRRNLADIINYACYSQRKVETMKQAGLPKNFKPKKHLSFAQMRKGLSRCFAEMPDKRASGKVNYSLHDAIMSAFACMYFQSPSLLAFQRQLEEEQEHRNNLQTLFGVKQTPEDSQLREIIDQTTSEHFRPFFKDLFSRLQRGKHLTEYQFMPGYYLCSLDGTQYHSSKKVHCSQCLTKQHKDGPKTYSHSVLQAAVMHPDSRQVIPLMPEEIKNTDGTAKQDCEINAAKRLLPKLRDDHPQLGFIMVGDGLFSKQPFIQKLREQRMHYILTAKPDDHQYMMEWLAAYTELHSHEWVDETGRKHEYQWMNKVPLNGGEKAPDVNFFHYRLIVKNKDGSEKVAYKNSWVTDLPIDKSNVTELVRGGRCRWKIENECFNTLKNQGYEIEHNYGYGSKNLCHNFYLLTLLAFTFHQILELTDKLFQACRTKWGSKRALWEKLRGAIGFFVFETWEILLELIYQPDNFHRPLLRHPP